MKTVLVIANIDTRGIEFRQYIDLIRSHGLNSLLMDTSMEQSPPFPGDIPCEKVARAGGAEIEAVRDAYRDRREFSTSVMIQGGRSIARKLFLEGSIHGVFGCGGTTSSLIATSIMRELPFGVPKVMATSTAGHPRYVGQFVGTRDITMLNTVVDVMGWNPLLDVQLRNAVAAICGMVHAYSGTKKTDRPVVAITSFGFAERCVEAALGRLREEGFEAVPFHAQGRGDRALDEMVRDGLVAGVVDVVTRGIGEELLHGNCEAGPDRVLAAAEAGIPMVVAPSGLDMVSLGGQRDWKARIAGRAHAVIDELRVVARTSAAECTEMARILADRLKRARAPYRVLLPLRGWSSLSAPGRPLWDPEADAAFADELKRQIDRPEWVKEVDENLYSREFGKAAVDAFLDAWKEHKASGEPSDRRPVPGTLSQSENPSAA